MRLPMRAGAVECADGVLVDSGDHRCGVSRPRVREIDSVIDVRAIYQQDHRDLKVEALPRMLLPRKGRFGLVDYEKAFTPDLKEGPDIFDLRGIDRAARRDGRRASGPVRRERAAAGCARGTGPSSSGFCSTVTKLACRLKRRVTAVKRERRGGTNRRAACPDRVRSTLLWPRADALVSSGRGVVDGVGRDAAQEPDLLDDAVIGLGLQVRDNGRNA